MCFNQLNTLDYLRKLKKKGYSGLYQIKTILGLKSLVKHYTFFSTFSTFGFPSYLIADVLVFGITSEKATGVLWVSTRESDHIHSHAQNRRYKLYFHAIHWYNQ